MGTSGREDPPEWLGEVLTTWLSYERNPFNGKAFFNEVHGKAPTVPMFLAPRLGLLCRPDHITPQLPSQVVFLFKPARVLVTADLFWWAPHCMQLRGSLLSSRPGSDAAPMLDAGTTLNGMLRLGQSCGNSVWTRSICHSTGPS